MRLWATILLCVAADDCPEEACRENSLLEMIRDFAPKCICSCPEICSPLGTLITAVMMGAEPMELICPDYAIWRCMAKDETTLGPPNETVSLRPAVL